MSTSYLLKKILKGMEKQDPASKTEKGLRSSTSICVNKCSYTDLQPVRKQPLSMTIKISFVSPQRGPEEKEGHYVCPIPNCTQQVLWIRVSLQLFYSWIRKKIRTKFGSHPWWPQFFISLTGLHLAWVPG